MQIEERRNLEKEIFFLTDTIIENIIELGNKNITENREKLEKCLKIMDVLIEKLAIYLSGKQEYLEELLRQLFSQKLPDQRVLSSFQHFSNNLESVIIEGLDRYKKCKLPEEKMEANNEALVNENLNHAEANTFQEDIPIDKNENQNQREIIIASSVETKGSEKGIVDSCDGFQGNEEQESEKSEAIDLEKILRQFFKGKKLIKNYKLHGIELPYFFPELNLAVELSSKQPNKEVWKEYYCTKANITLISISQEELSYYRRISKLLRRFLSSEEINNKVGDISIDDALEASKRIN